MSQPSRDTNPPPKKPFSLSLSGSSTPNGQPKKASFNLTSSSRDQSNKPLPRRPHQLHHDDESGDEDEQAPTHEAVTGFDTDTGAIISADGEHVRNEKQPLVIPVTSKNNWRDRPGVNHRPNGKNLLPKEVQAMQEAERTGKTVDGDFEKEGPSMSYGLSYAQPSQQEEKATDGDRPMRDAPAATEEQQQPQQPSRTEDEIALQALLRDSNGETQGRSDLVIESAKPDGEGQGDRYDETGSFRTDVQSRPESATLDQYNAVPVEEFGAALLRGMGWKDGQAIGRGNYSTPANSDRAIRPRIPERRPGFLGIGAKDVSGGKGAEMELGAWGKSSMRKGARKAESGKEGESNTEGVYMPVLMKNKHTGDYITEEELRALQKDTKSKKSDEDEWKERRDRNLEKSGRDRDRDRDRDNYRDREYRKRDYENDDDNDRYERRRTGSSRRDRSLSGDRHSRRRRHEDEDRSRRDDRYYRDKERDRERHRDRDRERTRDRDRDRSHRYRDDDRHSSRHSSSRSSRHGRDYR